MEVVIIDSINAMKNYKIVLQEDDRSPDARETFLNNFYKKFGMHFTVWKRGAKNISKYDDEVILEQERLRACNSASYPYWVIYEQIDVLPLEDDPTEEPASEEIKNIKFWFDKILPKKYYKGIKTFHMRITEKEMNKHLKKK
jgi:hypothetical protein